MPEQEEVAEDVWGFDCQPLNLLFGEPPSYHGDPASPYTYPWPHTSSLETPPPKISLALPDSSVSLMAHHVWESSIKLSDSIANGTVNVCRQNVLELGAGSAIPCVISLHMGARFVVSTDYPEEPILEGIRANLELNAAKHAARSAVVGHMWGDDTTPMLAALEASYSPLCDETYPGGFDAILVADCLYWAHLHRPLLETCTRCLRADGRGRVIISFQYHNIAPDAFLAMARDEFGLHARQLARINLSWAGLIDVDYTPDVQERADGIGFIRGPVYLYELH